MSDRPVVWITGASSGLGLAAAKEIAARGWPVVISGRNAEVLAQACGSLAGDVHAVPVDVTNAAAVTHAAVKIAEEFGPIGALVANAGTNIGRRAWGEVTGESFGAVVDINLKGVFHSIDAVLPGMRESGSGTIVAVSSFAGWYVTPQPGPAYTASKMALIGLIASLNGAEFRNGIRATALCPGEIATPAMSRRVPPPSPESLTHMLQPADVARTIAFVLEQPAHVTINELVLTPTWNGAYNRIPGPAPGKGKNP